MTMISQFDFAEALRLSLAERYRRCLMVARELALEYQALCDYPCVPDVGAGDDEIARLRAGLHGIAVPPEYELFLRRCRYLALGTGLSVAGFDHEGLSVVGSPWLSTEHRQGHRYLVFADYWKYADGDQLMVDLDDSRYPVVAYLHSHGPLFEPYSPSFSLALWRMVHGE